MSITGRARVSCPRTWRALGGFSAFVVALFTEMYGYPLTVYRRVRHPQYLGFILIMFGFLLQWPTFATLAMFPILLFVYRRLATREERDVAAEFGLAWRAYAAATPRLLPRRGVTTRPSAAGTSGLGRS